MYGVMTPVQMEVTLYMFRAITVVLWRRREEAASGTMTSG